MKKKNKYILKQLSLLGLARKVRFVSYVKRSVGMSWNYNILWQMDVGYNAIFSTVKLHILFFFSAAVAFHLFVRSCESTYCAYDLSCNISNLVTPMPAGGRSSFEVCASSKTRWPVHTSTRSCTDVLLLLSL